MRTPIQTGDRVNIRAGDEKGGWGIVVNVAGENPGLPTEYHVGMYNDLRDVRVFERGEITKAARPST